MQTNNAYEIFHCYYNDDAMKIRSLLGELKTHIFTI